MSWFNFCGGCDITTALLGLLVFLGVFWLFRSKKRRNYPPGPTGLPIIGYMPFIENNPGITFTKLKAKYGSIMSLRMGQEDWVILNDFATINEAFVKKGETFSGRPTNEYLDIFTEGKSMAMADYGARWKTLRKFGLTTLRGFGVGKKGMEANVIEETPYLIESLTTKSKMSLRSKIAYGVGNIICRIVFGSRYAYDDEDFVTLNRIMTEFNSETWEMKLTGFVALVPFLRHLPGFTGVMKTVQKVFAEYNGIFEKIKDERKATYDENHIRGFTDAFIKEMRKRGEDDDIFTDKQLVHFVSDLFEAGSATTTSTLNWMLLAFLHYPECQEKIYKEIEATIGETGTPSMKHRDEMPYTRAFIQETMRHRPLIPIGIFHKNNAEATLNGYTIPKNTTIVPNIWAVHYDPKTFENPEEFRPERFLDANGEFVKSNQVIPFSIGPRHCLGEQLATMEIFIFLTGIVQQLEILPDPAHPPPTFSSGIFNTFFYESYEFDARFRKR